MSSRLVSSIAVAAGILISAHGVTISQEAPPQTIPSDFADAPAIVLEDYQSWTVHVTRGTFQRRFKMRIQSRKGLEHADQFFVYDESNGRLGAFSAKTTQPDGTSVELTQELIQDSVGYKDVDSEIRVVRFTFPAVRVGSVLEWNYTIFEDDPRFTKHWETQREIPVLEARYLITLKHPPGVEPVVASTIPRGGADGYCKVDDRKIGGRTSRIGLVCRNLPAFPAEPQSPPTTDSRASYTIMWGPGDIVRRTWSKRTEALRSRIEEFTADSEAARTRARELAADAESDADKLDRIYSLLQAELTVLPDESRNVLFWSPEAANVDEILENRAGTPVEITLLAMIMFQEAGLKTMPIAVRDRRAGEFDFAALNSLQHLMLNVGVDGRGVIVDPSCRYCVPGLTEWHYSGSLAITLGAMMPIRVAEIPAEFNTEQHRELVRVRPDGTADVEGQIIWGGQLDIALRERWQELTVDGRQHEILAVLPRAIGDSSVMTSDPDNVLEPLTATYRYTRSRFSSLHDGRILLRPTDTFSSSLPIPIQEHRRQPLWLPHRSSIHGQTVFDLPPGFEPLNLPSEKVTIDGPGLSFDYIWAAEGRRVLFEGTLVMQQTEIPVESYEAASAFAREVRDAMRDGLSIGSRRSARSEP